MSRALTAGFIAEALAAGCSPCLFVEGEFATATLRLWTGLGDIAWNGQTWLGNGYVQNVTEGEETSDMQATRIVVHLTGVPELQVSFALTELLQNKPGKIWFGFVNSSGAVVVDPYLTFEGKLDTGELVDTPEGGNLQITYETHAVDLERPKANRYTDEGQKRFYPDDKGFEFVARLKDLTLQWGTTGKDSTKRPPKRRNPFQ